MMAMLTVVFRLHSGKSERELVELTLQWHKGHQLKDTITVCLCVTLTTLVQWWCDVAGDLGVIVKGDGV